jgi:uncharacterized repeat protein (TIGR01451 family)
VGVQAPIGGAAASFVRLAKRLVPTIGVLLCANASYAGDFAILHHERLGPIGVAPASSKASSLQSLKPVDETLLSFTAFGREFRARLERNDRLLRGLPLDARSSLRGVDVFRGELVDVPGSWVRLTRAGTEITGVVFDGAELFAIDSPRRLAPYLRRAEPEGYTGPIIYRWRDTAGALTDGVGELLESAPSGGEALSSTAQASVLDPARELDLGLVADAELALALGPHAAASILSRANILDGLFLFQLGLHVNVTELAILSQEPDPFSAAEPLALLDELEEYRATTPAQSDQDLTHLLTGRDLVEPASQTLQVIGFANFAAVCDARLGTALTQATFGITADALIMAHEIGHNFGAPHDGQPGSPCANESTSYIMAETYTNSREFSACSIQQMQPELQSACLDVLAPGDIELRTVSAPADAVFGENFEVHVAVDNPSATDANGVELTVAGANLTVVSLLGTAFDCTVAPIPRCRITALASGRSAELRIVATANTPAPAALDVAVDAFNDSNDANNAASYTIGVQPTVDLVVDFLPGPAIARLGEQVQYRATVRNAGSITATNVVARVDVTPTWLTVLALSSDIGTCAQDGLLPRYTCPLGDLAPGDTRSLSLEVRTTSNIASGFLGTSIRVEVSADQRVLDWSRRVAEVSLIIAEAVADLRTTVTPMVHFPLNEQAEITITIDNLGPDPAADVVLEQRGGQSLDEGLTGVLMTSNVGGCMTPIPGTLLFSCEVSVLPVGQSLVVTLRATGSRNGQWGITSTARQRSWDPDRDNNAVTELYTVGTFTIAPPPPGPGTGGTGTTGGTSSTASQGGGGGGAVGVCYLALLGLALAARRLRRQARSSEHQRGRCGAHGLRS